MIVVLVAVMVGAGVVRGQDRVARSFGHEQGLTGAPVKSLAQDSTGFLWIGAEGGLFRFNGNDIRRWAPDVVHDPVVAIAVSPRGVVVIQDHLGTIYHVTDRGARRIPGPGPPGPPAGYGVLEFDASGRLWTVDGGRLAVRRRDREWVVFEADAFGGEPTRRLAVGRKGTVYVATTDAVWSVRLGTTPRRLAALDWVVDLLPLQDGRLAALTFSSRIVEIGAGEPRDLVPQDFFGPNPPRGIELAVRGTTIWAALDRFLVALRPEQPPRVLGPEDGIVGAGPLLVDHEGSLWLASFSGLSQYPEPETRIWRDRHGLPSQHTRFVVRVGDRIWVTTWQGTAVVRRTAGGRRAETVPWLAQHVPCVDAGDDVWLGTAEGLVRVRGDTAVQRFGGIQASLHGCATGDDGLWIASAVGLLHAHPRAGTVRRVPGLPFDSTVSLTTLMLDRVGRLWIARGERICAAPAAAVAGPGPAGWTCDDVAGSVDVRDLVERPDGGLWAATRGGVFARRDDGGWRPVPASLELPTPTVFSLLPSPAGGIWVLGHGVIQRVRPRDDEPGGWEVLERLSAWHGLPALGGEDLTEDDDGTLWITTSRGLVRVPPEARFAAAPPPRVAAVEAWMDQERIGTGEGLVFPHDHGNIEIRFAALSFRDPSRVQRQVRLSESEPWVDASGRPAYRWVHVSPGRYRAEFRASLDGRRWSVEPARLAFTVQPPWYREPWALALFALLGVASLLAAYRSRVAFLLGLERQRTRIAIDLHDELGSGIGSIGILSGVLASDVLDRAAGRSAAAEIAETAEELGSALSDIVWSLDRRAATLEDLGTRLSEAGARFFSCNGAEFTAELPDRLPSATLPLAIRRNVLLIGLEALHNAARHAAACRVTLALRPRGRRWELSVRDDGVGLDDAGGATRGGLGRRGMRLRAAEIGADLCWSTASGGGTVVTLRFALRPPRLAAWRARLARRRCRAHPLA